MAAGREGRAERLNERLRGAQRANVDESFSLDLGGLDIPASTSPAAVEAPSSSSRRQGQDSDAISAASRDLASSARRRSARLGSRDLRGPSPRGPPLRNSAEATPTNHADITPTNVSTAKASRMSTIARSALSQKLDPIPDELEALPVPAFVRSPAAQETSPAQTRMSTDMVEESPTNAPGSGKRRRVPLSEVVSSSVRLLDTMPSDDGFPASSSPLARRVRRSDATSIRHSSASVSKLDLAREVDEEESPEKRNGESMADNDSLGMRSMNGTVEQIVPDTESDKSVNGQVAQEDEETEPEPEPEPVEESMGEQPEAPQEEDLEEDTVKDAAETSRASGRKRPRPSREMSPELGSEPAEEAAEDEVEAGREDPQPAPKRRRPRDGPAARKPPAIRKRSAKPKPRAEGDAREDDDDEEPSPNRRQARKPRRRRGGEDEGDGNDDAIFEITVQRFIHHKRRGGEDDDTDPLHAEIPFANRGGETVVDVFAQVCDEIITSTLGQLKDMIRDASDAAKKKEARIKIRAIEAYREELNARLLQHTIHLNHWHSLRRRLRHVQKEKMALREEIMRIRGEREQVALRMDAVRIKHEADSKEAKYCLDASALMHDVDLAVEQGRDAPELSGREQKEAELANLELVISRISQEASSASSSGGMLKQVKDFNAFLERAAVALETR